MRRLSVLVFFFIFLLFMGCREDYKEKVQTAEKVCADHGQKFMTLGVDGVSFSAYCFQENPARWFRYEMP